MGIATVHYLSMNVRDGQVDIPDTAGPDSVYEDWTGDYTFKNLSVPNVYTVDWGDGSSTETVVMGGAISSMNASSFEATVPFMFDDPNPYQMTILPDGKTAYVTQPYAGLFNGNPVGRISIVDLQSKKVLNNIEIPTPWYVWGITSTSDGKTVYVAASEVPGNEGQVFVIDTKKKKVTAQWPAGEWTSGVTLNPDESQLWVTSRDSGEIRIFNTATGELVDQINAAGIPNRGVFSNAGDVYYYTNSSGDGNVVAVDTSTLATLGTVETGGSPFGICKNTDGSRLAVALNNNAAVSIIGTSPFEELDTVSVDNYPWDITSANDVAYVTTGGQLAAIDINTAVLLTNVFVGDNANGVVVSPDGSTVYVTAYGWSDCDTQDTDFVLSHNYPDPGTYTITATDQNGQVDVKGTVVVAVD